jgi:hypothetical protein
MVWADAGTTKTAVRDRVIVRTADGDMPGCVLVIPKQWVQAPTETIAVIVAVLPLELPSEQDSLLPGSELPPLGSVWEREGVHGMVTGIDPVALTVTVTGDNGEIATVEMT